MSQREIVEVTIKGEPVAKERPRTFVDRGGKIRTITPDKTRAAEVAIGYAVKAAMTLDEPTLAKVGVAATFYCGPTNGPQYECDLDNLIKTVLDGCNKIAWKDDRQVLTLCCAIHRNAADPRIELTIWEEL